MGLDTLPGTAEFPTSDNHSAQMPSVLWLKKPCFCVLIPQLFIFENNNFIIGKPLFVLIHNLVYMASGLHITHQGQLSFKRGSHLLAGI